MLASDPVAPEAIVPVHRVGDRGAGGHVDGVADVACYPLAVLPLTVPVVTLL